MTSKLEEIEAKLVEQRRFFEDLRVQIVNTHTTVIANALNKQIISEAIAELHAYEQTHPKEGANTKRLVNAIDQAIKETDNALATVRMRIAMLNSQVISESEKRKTAETYAFRRGVGGFYVD